MSPFPPEKHPPKPHLTLRVGITGHRPNKLNTANLPRIAVRLDEVMKAIDRIVAQIYHASAEVYSAAPVQEKPDTKERYRIRLISGFAEGVDQMAIAAAPATWRVEAILPFPKDEYRKDFVQSVGFDQRDVTREFDLSLERANVITALPAPANPARRDYGYVLAGSYMLRQLDLLIAVWDGEQPMPGGTGAIVQQAHDGGIPVIWISADAAKVQFVGKFEDEKAIPSLEPWGDQALKTLLDPILEAPSPMRRGGRPSPRDGLDRLYREVWLPECNMPYYDIFTRWIAGRRPLRRKLEAPDFDKAVAEFQAFVSDKTPLEPLRERIRDVLAPRFAWADALAIHFSHSYRSAYVLSYLLAALAVFIALFGIFLKQDTIFFQHDALWVKGLLVAFELAAIFQILRLVRHGRRHAWHERWLEYRIVAEGMRHGRFLSCVSEFGHIRHDRIAPQAWTVWYIRATMREIGLPAATLDEAYQRAVLQQTETYEIDGQISYHSRNAELMETVDHYMHRRGTFYFRWTLYILSAFAILLGGALLGLYVESVRTLYQQYFPVLHPDGKLELILDVSKLLVVLFAAGFPAIGAALAGIRVQGDFEGSKERSERMVAELEALKETCKEARALPRLEKTADTLLETARILSEDLAAWQELYGRKRLNLPS